MGVEYIYHFIVFVVKKTNKKNDKRGWETRMWYKNILVPELPTSVEVAVTSDETIN